MLLIKNFLEQHTASGAIEWHRAHNKERVDKTHWQVTLTSCVVRGYVAFTPGIEWGETVNKRDLLHDLVVALNLITNDAVLRVGMLLVEMARKHFEKQGNLFETGSEF